MKRSIAAPLVALPMAAFLTAALTADVKTREKTHFKLEGMLGRMVGMFGGKAAREGILSTTALKGNRKASIGDVMGQIVDLDEEKVYDLDMNKKEYRVTTFEELRRRMREAQERAQKEAQREAQREQKPEKPSEPQKEVEIDFDAKETGQRKQIAGNDARQVIMTVTIREKGKTLDEAGGLVMTADSWLGPEIAALKELQDFDMRYYTKLYGGAAMGVAAEQMAMLLGMYPGLKAATERLKQEETKLKGTPLAMTTTFEAVVSKAALDEQQKQQKESGGGLSGMLARRMMKKEDPKQRATVFTLLHEFQEISTSASPADVQVPAGFKQK